MAKNKPAFVKTTAGKPILVSGVKPTARPHIGNYFGAMREFRDYQNEYDSYIFVANYHALTTLKNSKELAQNTLDVVIDYLAIGLDPKKVTLYAQTAVIAEVAELTWILNCLVTVPYLSRAHAYKDAIANGKEANVGLFDYPMLMAADILLPEAEVVPVGEDQRQHVEYARDAAEKFNAAFGETFKLPKALIRKDVAVVTGIDGRKMSKSYGNTIELFASDEEIKSQVMKIVTDSKGVSDPKDPEQDNIFALHKLFSPADELEELRERMQKGGIGYQESKEILIKNIVQFIAPLREKRAKIASDLDYVQGRLEEGGQRAHTRESKKMSEVRERVGLV